MLSPRNNLGHKLVAIQLTAFHDLVFCKCSQWYLALPAWTIEESEDIVMQKLGRNSPRRWNQIAAGRIVRC